jgi:hypothetical protein
MGSFGNYLENKVLDHVVGKTAFTMPTAYVALSTTVPTDAGNVTEPVGNGYARKQTAGADWNAAATGSISNALELAFPQASGDWGTIQGFALYDAASNGNMLAWGTLSANKAVGNGDTAKFAAGQLTITLD